MLTIARMLKREDRRREMRHLLSLRESEGLSLRALSQRTGIPIGTLSWWSHHLRQAEPMPRFAEVRVVDAEEPQPALGSGATVVLRHETGMTIELRGAAAHRIVDQVLACLDRWS